MPLFLIETSPMTDGQRDDLYHLSARRFPEVAIERGFARHDAGQEVWLCRAPSRERLARWAAAAALPLHVVRHVDPVPLRKQTKEPNHDRSR